MINVYFLPVLNLLYIACPNGATYVHMEGAWKDSILAESSIAARCEFVGSL